MYNIYHLNRGRLGNSLFRYFASIILHCKDSKYKYSSNVHTGGSLTPICDNNFFSYLNESLPQTHIQLLGYFQYQEIFDYKDQIIRYIRMNENDQLLTDRNEVYTLKSLMNTDVAIYDYVLHIRLEDFVDINEVISVEKIIDALNGIPIKGKMAIVMNKPKTDFEKNYLNRVLDALIYREIIPVVETNTIEVDFAIMRNCKNLICSNSTISWCAAILSENMNCCYMPDYAIFRSHQTMKRPHENTVFYSL